jgi:predicted glycosyltransferase
VRVWIDLTNSPHVPLYAPVVRALQERGDTPLLTARDFAQTVGLAELHGLDVEVIGQHGGRSRAGKARAAAGRVAALARWARRTRPDVALAHGSTDMPIVSRLLRIRSTTMLDYEQSLLQQGVCCRLANRVLAPEAIPLDRLERLGARARKVVRYPGIKEEYALADFEPDAGVPAALGVRPEAILAVLRPPPELALYHRMENPLFEDVLRRLAATPEVDTVVLPRYPSQGVAVRALGLDRVIVPEEAVDAQSLLAAADVVVSAGGTMNREAVVLGTPVYTGFAGRMGAVDEMLIREGRLRRLVRPEDVVVERKATTPAERVRRDPADMLQLAFGSAPRR